MQLCQESHHEVADAGLSLGLAWHMLDIGGAHDLIMHDGGTNGYVSFAGFIPETQTAVVILCNSGDALSTNHMVGQLGMELLEASQAHLETQEDSEVAAPESDETQPAP
jgi:hypothetical protein